MSDILTILLRKEEVELIISCLKFSELEINKLNKQVPSIVLNPMLKFVENIKNNREGLEYELSLFTNNKGRNKA